jgi:hypothetical protein
MHRAGLELRNPKILAIQDAKFMFSSFLVEVLMKLEC